MASSNRPKTAPPQQAGVFGIQKNKDADAVKANKKGTKGNFSKTVNTGKASGSPISRGRFPNTENLEDGEYPEPDYPEEQLPVKSKEEAKQEKKNQKKIHDEYHKLQLDTKQLLERWKKKIETIPYDKMMATLSTIITDIGNQQVQLGDHLAKYKETEIKSYPQPPDHQERETTEADGDRNRSEVLVDRQYPMEQPEIKGKQEADDYMAKNNSLNDKIEKLEKLLNEKRKQLAQHEKQELARAQVYETQVKTLKSLLEEREVESRKYEMEKNEALSRLSEIAGRRLRDNNPNVTDLSTQIRPIKIAEMYRELYDNQWTDAFFTYNEKRMGQEDIIKKLLKILTKAYKFCLKKCIRIDGALTSYGTYLNMSEEEAETLKLPEECQSLTKQLRKSLASVLLSEIQKEFLKTYDSEPNELKAYCQKCVEITWYMNVQTPPMVLVEIPRKGSEVDNALYSFYTVSGKLVDYVVWPACRFDNGGNLLSKGVIQPSKENLGQKNTGNADETTGNDQQSNHVSPRSQVTQL